jgi:thermitase
VIVKFKGNSQGIIQKLGLKTVGKIDRIGAVVVSGKDTVAMVNELSKNPNVLYAEPNYIAKINQGFQAPEMRAFGDGDSMLKDCWGIAKIEAPAAWAAAKAKGTDLAAVKVAVVDTGIDYRHADLAGRVNPGRDFINNDDDAMDDNAHGTHCAGTIGAGIDNGGVVGVNPYVSMLAVKVLSGSGSGSYEAVAKGIIYAADQGSDIISMSLGGPAGSKALQEAVNYAISKKVLVIAAMGNDNSESPSWPAAIPGVMAVGSTTVADARSSFSNFGKHISVSAPGSDILSTVPGGGYKRFSGTSMATPHVAGLASLVKGAFPGISNADLRSKIEKSAVDLGDAGFDKNFGFGRVNALKAVQ